MSDIVVDISTRASMQGFEKMDAAERSQLIKLKQLELGIKQAEAAQLMYGKAAEQAAQKAEQAATRTEAANRKAAQSFTQRMNLRNFTGAALTQSQRNEFRSFMQTAPAGAPVPASVLATQMILKQRSEAAQQKWSARSIAAAEQRTAETNAADVARTGRLNAHLQTMFNRERRVASDAAARRHGNWLGSVLPGAEGAIAIDAAAGSEKSADLETRARRYVANRIKKTPELLGRVSEQEFEQMVKKTVDRFGEKVGGLDKRLANEINNLSRRPIDGSYGNINPTNEGPPRPALARGRVRGVLSRLGDQASSLGGQLGLAGTVAGGGLVLKDYVDQSGQLGGQLVALERLLAPIYGVGSNGSRRMRLRNDQIGKSIAYGIDLEGVAGMTGRLQAIAADLPQETQDEIMRQTLNASSLGVQNLEGLALGINALQRTFAPASKDPKSTRALMNKWFNAADRGGVDVDSFTPYLSSVTQAAKIAGYDENDVFALTEIASKAAMKDETLARTVRDIPLKIVDATRLGKMSRTGNMFADITQIQRMSPEQLVDVFGIENAAGARFVLDNAGDLKAARDRHAATTGDESVVEQKRVRQLSDPTKMVSSIIASAQQASANAERIAATNPALAGRMTDKALSDAGIDIGLADQGDIVRGGMKLWAGLHRLIPGGTGLAGEMLFGHAQANGIRFTAKQLEDNKLTTEAAALKLRFGSLFGLKNERGEFTSAGEAEHYEQTVARLGLPNVTETAFLKFRGRGLDDKTLRQELAVESAVQLGQNRAAATQNYRLANDSKYRDANTIKPRDYQFGTSQYAIDAIYQGVATRKRLFGQNEETAVAGDVLWRKFADDVAATRNGEKVDAAKDESLRQEVTKAFATWSESARDTDLTAYESSKTSLEAVVRGRGANALQARQRLGAMNKLEEELGRDGDISAKDAAQLRAASEGRAEAYSTGAAGDGVGNTMQNAVNQFAQVVNGLAQTLQRQTGQPVQPTGNSLPVGPAPTLTPPAFMPTPGMLNFGG